MPGFFSLNRNFVKLIGVSGKGLIKGSTSAGSNSHNISKPKRCIMREDAWLLIQLKPERKLNFIQPFLFHKSKTVHEHFQRDFLNLIIQDPQ